MVKYGRFAKKILIVVILSLTVWLFAEHQHHLRGKEIVAKGKKTTIKGELILKDEGWFLKKDNKLIEMHFGPESYREHLKIKIKPTKNFECEGYLYKDSFAVSSFMLDKKKIVLRDEKGKALWQDTEFSHPKTKNTEKEKMTKSKKKKIFYIVDRTKCIGCKLCVVNCPVKAITMVNGRAVIDADKCIACGICANGNNGNFKGCPVGAISKSE